ncbi:MAG TPA: nuclear transport factor 2 family protein [Pyrinomonadaceae bacterium]|nr:nuclear transport factor 2 family protein [Pyrinomonadaceae bacterium]
MKHYAFRLVVALLTFAIGLTAATLLGTSRVAYSSDSSAAQEVLRVENQYIQAHLNRDVATLDNVLADDFTIRSRRGLETKFDRLELLQNPDFAFAVIDTSNVQVEVDGDTAIVSGTAYVVNRYGDEELTSPTYTFTRRYEKRQGRWQIVSVTTRRG